MKTKRLILSILAVLLLVIVLSGCGPKGGTITLVNESTLSLNNVRISMGDSKTETLYPGQWIRASVDKNRNGFTVAFGFGIDSTSKDKVTISRPGNWFVNRWTSDLISVHDGEAVVITVRNKPE